MKSAVASFLNVHYKIINDFSTHLLSQIFLLVVKIKLLVLSFLMPQNYSQCMYF